MLKRAPLLLRVTVENDKIDALDQPQDIPRPTEKLFAYSRVGEPGMIHIYARKASGFYSVATYQLLTTQPPDQVMRDNQAWQHFLQTKL